MTGVFPSTLPINLGQARVTITQVLRQGATELVQGAPISLVSTPGSSPTLANYLSLGIPLATMQIAQVPFVGRAVQITLAAATVGRPSTCGLFFGTAALTTSFRLDDGVNVPVVVTGTQPWACVPAEIISP